MKGEINDLCDNIRHKTHIGHYTYTPKILVTNDAVAYCTVNSKYHDVIVYFLVHLYRH